MLADALDGGFGIAHLPLSSRPLQPAFLAGWCQHNGVKSENPEAVL